MPVRLVGALGAGCIRRSAIAGIDARVEYRTEVVYVLIIAPYWFNCRRKAPNVLGELS